MIAGYPATAAGVLLDFNELDPALAPQFTALFHTLADALKSLKQGVARRLIGDADHFWQKRYYDFNIRNYPQFVEKLRYIHRNPVKEVLCEHPEDWQWSSACGRAT